MTRLGQQLIVALELFLLAALGCHQRTSHEMVEERITEEFASLHIRPLSDPVAILAHNGAVIPQQLLQSNRVTLVEVIPKKGELRVLYENTKEEPPSDGFITDVRNAHNIGLAYPATPTQSLIWVRVNYFCEMGDSVAIHLVVPNPLVETRKP